MTEPKVINIPDAEALEREAAHWFVRFDTDEISDADRREFQEWYGKSQQHRDALDRVSAFWGGAEVLSDLKDYAAADDVAKPLEKDEVAHGKQVTRRRMVGAIAASFFVISGVAVTNVVLNWDREFSNRYVTAIGEQEMISLPDGSEITLNTNSALQVAFGRDARRIELTSGEAFFNVASDPNRPFSVITVNGVVTAVGTAFSVRVHNEKIDVLVTEGRVSLVAAMQDGAVNDTGAANVTEVSAGQAIEFAQSARTIEIVKKEEAEKTLDWQDGMISFNGETLEEVIANLGRYTDLTIDIAGDELKQQKIVAYYRVGEIEPMFQALSLMAGVEVERVSEGHVRLYRAE